MSEENVMNDGDKDENREDKNVMNNEDDGGK